MAETDDIGLRFDGQLEIGLAFEHGGEIAGQVIDTGDIFREYPFPDGFEQHHDLQSHHFLGAFDGTPGNVLPGYLLLLRKEVTRFL